MTASTSESQVQSHHDQDVTVRGASVLHKPTARFEWKQLLEEGATGRVHLVRDHWVSRDVVLKQVLPRFLEDEDILKRFFQKMSLTRPLLHAHLVPYYELHFFQLRWTYESEEGEQQEVLDTPSYYLSLPQLEGKTLDRILEELPLNKTEGPSERPLLPLESVKNLFLQISEALAFSHEQGVTHDGLTTASVFCEISEEGLPGKSSLSGHWLSVDLQRYENSHNRRLPSLLYMPPEQLKLIPHHGRLQQHDLFALGVIAYQLLTGQYPYYHPEEWEQFATGDLKTRPGIVVIDRYRRLLQGQESLGDSPSSVKDIRQQHDLPHEDLLNPEIESALMRCISLNPEVRPKSVREMLSLFDHPWSSLELQKAEELRVTKGEIRKLIHIGDLDLAMEELELAEEDFPEDEEILFMNLTLQGLHELQLEQRQSQEEIRQVQSQMKEVRKESSKAKVKARAVAQEAEQKSRELQRELEETSARLSQFEEELIKRNQEKKELEAKLQAKSSAAQSAEEELTLLREQIQNNVSSLDDIAFERDRLAIESKRHKKELLSAIVLVVLLLCISVWSFLRKPSTTAKSQQTLVLEKKSAVPRVRPQPTRRPAAPTKAVSSTATKALTVAKAKVKPVAPRSTAENVKPPARNASNDSATPSRQATPAPARRAPVTPTRAAKTIAPAPRKETQVPAREPLFEKRPLSFATGSLDLKKPCFRRGYVYGCFRRCLQWNSKRTCVRREAEKQCGCMRDVLPAKIYSRVLKVSSRKASYSLRRAKRRNYLGFRPCASLAYKTMTRGIRKSTTVEVSWKDGEVTKIGQGDGPLKNEQVTRCLRDRLRDWKLRRANKGAVNATIRLTARTYATAPTPWDRNCGKKLLFKCFNSCTKRVRRNGRRRCLRYGRRCGCVRQK